MLVKNGALGGPLLVKIAFQELEVSPALCAVRIAKGLHAPTAAKFHDVPMGVYPGTAGTRCGETFHLLSHMLSLPP